MMLHGGSAIGFETTYSIVGCAKHVLTVLLGVSGRIELEASGRIASIDSKTLYLSTLVFT